MKKLLLFLALLLWMLPAPVYAATRATGFCEQGSSITVTSLTAPFLLTDVQRSYPSCTVTVYNTGTLNLATIYSDNINTVKANPFTADATGLWFFYGVGRFDVKLSGGGITTPFTIGDIPLSTDIFNSTSLTPFGYTDLRTYGAVCDGATNSQSAVAAARAAGLTRLFLPPNCVWNPTGQLIPANLDIYGGDLLTSKIWTASPTTQYLSGGSHVTLQHLNVNHEFCINAANATGCPLYSWNNQDDAIAEIVETYPYSINSDVGSGLNSPGIGFNWAACTQRGDGGCLYGQFLGGRDHSTGSGIQAQTAFNGASGQALLVTRVADGIGTVFADLAGSEGVAHPPQPSAVFSSVIKQHGDYLDFFQAGSNWDGNGIWMNHGAGSGTFTGNFFRATNNLIDRFNVDYVGNVYHTGMSESQAAPVLTAGATLVPVGAITRISGAGAISNITLPTAVPSTRSFCLYLIPNAGATWTTTTGGNIALGSTAVANKLLIECYDATDQLFYPSY